MLLILISFVLGLCTLEKVQIEESTIRRNINILSNGLRHVPYSKRDDLDDLIGDLNDDFEADVIQNQLENNFTQNECIRRLEWLGSYQYKVDKLSEKVDQYTY